MNKTITAYKGFEKDFTCRNYQFQVGQTYKHEGCVEICSAGFHACTDPFDVWNCYGPFESRFAEVELSGATKPHSSDSKVAAAEITIKAELTLPEFVRRAVEAVIEATKGKQDKEKVGSSGDFARIGSAGHSAKIGSSGNSAKIGSSGDFAQIGSSGHSAYIGSSGHSAYIGSSGDFARIGSSGHSAQIGSSGNFAHIGSSGNFAQISSNGNFARIGSSGNSAQISSSGNSARIEASGKQPVIASAGRYTRAKGAKGTWISLAEFDDNGACVGFATGCIGKNRLKPDTWYVAKGGKLVEAT